MRHPSRFGYAVRCSFGLVWFVILLLFLPVFSVPLYAFITTLWPLRSAIEQEKVIVLASISKILPEKPGMILQIDELLKGKLPFKTLTINLTGDTEGVKNRHKEALLERIEPQQKVILFISGTAKRYRSVAFTQGTWFSLQGEIEKVAEDNNKEGKDKEKKENITVRWRFLHAEPYLRKSYHGDNETLTQLIRDVVSNKKVTIPEPDASIPPGFGPTLKEKKAKAKNKMSKAVSGPEQILCKNNQSIRFSTSLFGLIQLPFIGLIAALAALFPTVFGGLALLMRRWMILLSFMGIWSIYVSLYFYWPHLLIWKSMQSRTGFFAISAGATLIALCLSINRYRRAISNQVLIDMLPRRLDGIVFLLLVLVVMIFIGVMLTGGKSFSKEPNLQITIVAFSILMGTISIFVIFWRQKKNSAHLLSSTSLVSLRAVDPSLNAKQPSSTSFYLPALLNPEGTMLLSLLLCFIWCFGQGETSNLWQNAENSKNRFQQYAEEGASSPENSNGENYFELAGVPKLNPKPKWVFKPKNGQLASSIVRTPDAIIAAVYHMEGFTGHFGTIYALDPETGKEKWKFDADEDLKPLFCTPRYDNGFLYFGEGFHKDAECRIYCIRADNGKQEWSFATSSHTESRPVVAKGKVVFGAGNDGIYCLNATTGKLIWHNEGLHIDAEPVIQDGRVFVGSGISMKYQINKLLCLDLENGKEVWQEKIAYSAFANPLIDDQTVYFGTGNGNYSVDREPIAGELLARNKNTGKNLWDCQLPNSILATPIADRFMIYVGCRDGNLYAIDKHHGKIVWKQNFGSPILSSPILIKNPDSKIGAILYVGCEDGFFVAMNPLTTKIFWSIQFQPLTELPYISLISTPLIENVLDPPVEQNRQEDQNKKLKKRNIYIAVSAGRLSKQQVNTPFLFCFEEETR